MLSPPISHLSPWIPDHWITQSGYALNSADVAVGTKGQPKRGELMLRAVIATQEILDRMMQPWLIANKKKRCYNWRMPWTPCVTPVWVSTTQSRASSFFKVTVARGKTSQA